MDRARPGIAIDLHGVATPMPGGFRRAPLRIRAGRIGAAASPRARRMRLDDHLVFPGLVNAHDHLHVNAVPPLAHAQPFRNSYEWMEAFKAHFAAPAVAAALAVPKHVRLRHGALKNLLAGTTCVAHHDPWHPALDAPDFPVAVVREYGWAYAPGWPEYGPDVRRSFAATPAGQPWMIHLAEGTDPAAQAELAALDASGCLGPNSVLVHCVGLSADDVERAIERGAGVVWCPSSNLALLGRTLDPRRLSAAGRLALGTDSRLTGARDMLEEMRGVLARGELPAAGLLEAATIAGARILRLAGRGRLAPGDVADLVLVRDTGPRATDGPAALQRSELRAVVRDGLPCLADPDLAEWFALADVETVPAMLDGRPKLLARWLADAAVAALEPGFTLASGSGAQQRDAAVAAAAGSR